jgi:hypothetical protein
VTRLNFARLLSVPAQGYTFGSALRFQVETAMRVIDANCNPEFEDFALRLELRLCDPAVVDWLRAFEPGERESKAAEALKVGIIALRSVTPVLDASIVDQKFKDLERELEDYANDFAVKLQDRLDRADGSLSQTFEEYFGVQNGRLAQLVRDQIGPESAFGRTLDPENSRGLLQRIQQVVEAKLVEAATTILAQFSLDKTDSAVSRLQSVVAGQIEQIKTDNARFFAQLKELIGVERGREMEAARGTHKGHDFQDAVYEHIAAICRNVGDLSENLTAKPGNIPRCKVGDFVTTLGSDSGAAGRRIVLEAKKEAGYSLRAATEELETAKENRDAGAGIMVFSAECAPSEVQAFRIVDRNIFISVDVKNQAETNLYLESAYRIARAMTVADRHERLTAEIDFGRIMSVVADIAQACERFAEIRKKAVSIKQSAGAIEAMADETRPQIEQSLREIERLARVC